MRFSPSLSALILAGGAVAALSGCASAPSSDEMARVPVVPFGQSAPADKNFVLLYRAGQALPITASVGGSLIERPAQSELMVTTKRDIWVYQQWASYDGKNWFKGSDLVNSEFKISLPGMETGKEPGNLSARFNQK